MPSKKYCINGCPRHVFAHQRCIYCYRREILAPRQKERNQSRPARSPIRKVSKKREVLNSVYDERKKAKWERMIEDGTNRCFFTNIWLDPHGPIPDFHHTLGRDGDLLTDDRYMFPCLFKPHREFHDMKHEYEYLERSSWYFPWLERMRTELPIIYWKEMKKIEKANYGKRREISA